MSNVIFSTRIIRLHRMGSSYVEATIVFWWCSLCPWCWFLFLLGRRVAGASTYVSVVSFVVFWVGTCGIQCLVSEIKKFHIGIGRCSTCAGISGSEPLISMKDWWCWFSDNCWRCDFSNVSDLSFSFFDTLFCRVFNVWAVIYRGICRAGGIGIGKERCYDGGIRLRTESTINVGIFQFP